MILTEEKNTVKETLAMMCEVVELDGTAKNIRIPELSIAGKTGTAQKPKNGTYSNDYLSSFVALVPGDKPQLLIITMIDEPSGRVNAGGKVAAPVARDIALGALAYSGHIPASSVQDGIQPAEPVKMSTLISCFSKQQKHCESYAGSGQNNSRHVWLALKTRTGNSFTKRDSP